MTTKTACPSCRAAGKDRTGDNLVVYEDNSSYCFSCGYYEFSTEQQHAMTKHKHKKREIAPLTGGKPVALKSRGISSKTMSRYGVFYLDGTLYFPIYSSVTGRLLNYKTRPSDLSRSFGWHEKGVDLGEGYFFGIQVRGGRKLVITTGETDALSFAEALDHRKYTVWGLSKGENSIAKALESVGADLSNFSHVYIAMDSDDTGQAAVVEATSRLPYHNTFVVHYPYGVKDANETLVSNGASVLRQAVESAQPMADKSVDTGTSLYDTMTSDEAVGEVLSTGWSGLDSIIGGWLSGHVYTLAADTGVGKSTLSIDLAVSYALLHDSKVLLASLEMSNRDVAYKLAASYLGIHTMNPRTLKKDPGFLDAARWVSEHFVLVKQKGYLEVKELQDMVKSARLYGADFFLLDHLTAAATGPEGLNWAGLDARAQALQASTAEENVITLNVTHISRAQGDDGDGTNPPSLGRIRGGNGLAQNSSCVLGLYAPEGKDEQERWVKILKVHRAEIGRWGQTEVFRLDADKVEELQDEQRNTKHDNVVTDWEGSDSEEQPGTEVLSDIPEPDRQLRGNDGTLRSEEEVHPRLSDSKPTGQDDSDGPEQPTDRGSTGHTTQYRGMVRSQGTLRLRRPTKDGSRSGTDRGPARYGVDAVRKPGNKDTQE